MGLADTWRAEDEHVFRLASVAAGGQLPNQLCIDGGLELEVELFDRLHRREVRDLDAHGDALTLLGSDLLLEQTVEEVEIGRLVSGRRREKGIDRFRSATTYFLPSSIGYRLGRPFLLFA
jgi:hypothetical protein